MKRVNLGRSNLLILWSGRRDSNPRRPAWESPRRLNIKDMASTAAIQIHGVSATYGHSFLNSPLMEWKWRVTVPYTFADKIGAWESKRRPADYETIPGP